MTKQQAILYCQEKAKYEGYITHMMLLELYNDDEEIPDCVIDFICYKPKPRRDIQIFVGSEGYKMWQKATDEYLDYLAKEEIINKIKEHPQS